MQGGENASTAQVLPTLASQDGTWNPGRPWRVLVVTGDQVDRGSAADFADELPQRLLLSFGEVIVHALCAFLPMLFWPGAAGEFMGMLPVTLIFVLAALLMMALI